jgi:carboxyl-terminal processing protease
MGRKGKTRNSIKRAKDSAYTRYRLGSFFVLLLAILASTVSSPPTVGNASRPSRDDVSLVSTSTLEGRLVVFDDVWETIQERYYDPNFHGVDWQAKRATFRPAAAKATGTHEFYEVLRQMISSLKDAHTRVYSPDEKFDWWNPRFVTVGLTIREVEGLPTVVQVEPDSAAARTDIRQGDVIARIDNVPVSDFIAQRLQNSGSPSDNLARFKAIAALFEGQPGTSVKVGWLTRDGRTKSAILKRYWIQRELGFSNQRKGKVAILRIDAFTQSVALEFSKTLPDVLRGVDSIVLDLRANGGGDAEAMADVASLLLDDGINLGRFADRAGASFELQTYSKRLWRVPQLSQIKLPLVVLTSESTSSAAEILAAALQTHGRAQVIGTNTCGCVLAIRNRHTLPDGGVLDVSEFDYRTADGVRLEGLGIRPDETVPLARADIYSRRDRALELARTILDANGRKS